jgi:phage tail sheath protein FI
MVDTRFHGVSTREFTNQPRAVEIIDISTIGLVGTCETADATNWPLNTPILITGEQSVPEGLTGDGTIQDALDDIFDQSNATIIAVRVAEGELSGGGEDVAATMSNIIGSRLTLTGMHALTRAYPELGKKPGLLIAPGYTSQRPADGIASIAVSNGGTGYDPANPPTVTITGDGYGASARSVVSSSGVVTGVILENPGVGYTSATVAFTADEGSDAAATATIDQVENPVTAEFISLAERLRAGVIADGPNTTQTDAVTARQGFGSDRLMIVDPWVKIFKDGAPTVAPPSARMAGLQVKVDREEGFWFSPSNHALNGVIGLSRTVTWGLSDPNTGAEYLNDNDVTTIIRNYEGGGYLAWGNRTTSNDSLKAFWSVRRTHDVIIESIEKASMIFVDKPFSVDLLVQISETASRFLRQLQAKGATLGSRVWLDPALNTAESFASGVLIVSYDAEGPAPAEHIQFYFYRNTGYYTELLQTAAREVERISA